MLANPKPTADQLVAEYIKIKDYLAQEAKRFADFCKPYNERQEAISNQMLEMLNQVGGESLKTEAGTAYKSTINTPKIIDREAYLDQVLENYDTFGAGMLQIGAPKKEAIDDYMQNHDGALPSGVEISSFVRVNIRRS